MEKLKYDHSQQDLPIALGLTERQVITVKAIVHEELKASTFGTSGGKQSQTIERVLSKMENDAESAFALYVLGKYSERADHMLGKLEDLASRLTRKLEHPDEKAKQEIEDMIDDISGGKNPCDTCDEVDCPGRKKGD